MWRSVTDTSQHLILSQEQICRAGRRRTYILSIPFSTSLGPDRAIKRGHSAGSGRHRNGEQLPRIALISVSLPLKCGNLLAVDAYR